MKLYEIIIKPLSGFGTPLKGDTIFGHVCWQAAYDDSLLNGGLDKWIACYEQKPFAVFSSACPRIEESGKFFYAVKRPDMPISIIFPPQADERRKRFEELKNSKKKKWLRMGDNLSLRFDSGRFLDDEQLVKASKRQLTENTKKTMRKRGHQEFYAAFEQQHNTINRLTMTTGEGMFAPFTEKASSYYPETELAVFVLLDEDATDIERVRSALERIGTFGFGRDASTGCGQFELGDGDEVSFPSDNSANACYMLAPSVPPEDMFRSYYFTPFIRFGKHGDRLATSENPFKNPVVMADEGAVFIPKNNDAFQKPYVGKAVLNTSKIKEHMVVHQGYAPYIPFRLEIDT
ncbi:MAG: hypothetical protein JXB42_04190 [Deltaproteobacteria bacterium]|nr:hypothetical protein [Deltaproteobacteria bacterium]